MEKKLNGMNITHVDTDTGEIICQTEGCIKIIDTTLSDQEKARKEYEETHVMNFNEGKSFVKLYLDVNSLRKQLTPNEFSVAISLADFICYEDCILRKGGHGNGKILDIKSLSEEMDIPYESLRKVIRSLLKKKVIAFFEIGDDKSKNSTIKTIMVNPYIYTKGQHILAQVLTIFSDTVCVQTTEVSYESES